MKEAHRELQGLPALPHLLTEKDDLALGRRPGSPGASLTRAHCAVRPRHTPVRTSEIKDRLCREDAEELELRHCWRECEVVRLLGKTALSFL